MNCPLCNEEMIEFIQQNDYRCCECGDLDKMIFPVRWCDAFQWTYNGVQYTTEQMQRISRLKAFL